MLDVRIRQRIDTARDILIGKVPDPKIQVEQLATARLPSTRRLSHLHPPCMLQSIVEPPRARQV